MKLLISHLNILISYNLFLLEILFRLSHLLATVYLSFRSLLAFHGIYSADQ